MIHLLTKLDKNFMYIWENSLTYSSYTQTTPKKERFKIIQLEKARFIKVNELKLIQVELF